MQATRERLVHQGAEIKVKLFLHTLRYCLIPDCLCCFTLPSNYCALRIYTHRLCQVEIFYIVFFFSLGKKTAICDRVVRQAGACVALLCSCGSERDRKVKKPDKLQRPLEHLSFILFSSVYSSNFKTCETN